MPSRQLLAVSCLPPTVPLSLPTVRVTAKRTSVIGRGMDFPDITLVVQAGLPMNSDAYTHRVGRTARAGKSGRAVIILTEVESFYLRINPQFPIVPHPASDRIVNDSASADTLEQAMQNVDEKTKQKGYAAYLGFMKPFENKLRMKSAELVQMANQFALLGLGCPEPPAMEKKTVRCVSKRIHFLMLLMLISLIVRWASKAFPASAMLSPKATTFEPSFKHRRAILALLRKSVLLAIMGPCQNQTVEAQNTNVHARLRV